VSVKIRFTTLSENTASYGFLAEWGLSILVEVDGLSILFDTGPSPNIANNARLAGIDLTKIDYIVLSHGHADHTGGLREVLQAGKGVDVIAHPDIWAAKYVRRDDERSEQYIGIPFTRQELEGWGAKFRLTKEPYRISEYVFTSGEIPMVSSYERVDDDLLVKDGALRQDPMTDDLSLVIDTDFGLVVVMGCAHRGIINTLRQAQRITGKEQVFAAIGGTHLFQASEERITKTIAELKTMGVQKLGLSHCTGFHASARLALEFGLGFFPNNAGTQFFLPTKGDDT